MLNLGYKLKTTQQNVWHYCDRNNAAMVAKGNRQIWRNRQIARQLTTYLSQILQIGKQAIAAVKMSETERQQAWQKAKEIVQSAPKLGCDSKSIRTTAD